VLDDRAVGVRSAQDPAAVAALRVEDPGEEALTPLIRRPPGRLNESEAGQVTGSIILVICWGHRESPGAHELVVECHVWPSSPALLGPDHMLPSPISQEAVIFARDELRSVLERDSIRRPRRSPVIEHFGDCVPAGGTSTNRPVDAITRSDFDDRLRSPVGHQDRGVAAQAVRARMRASSVRVDRVAEGDRALGTDLVDDRARAYAEELEAAEFAGPDLAPQRLLEHRQLRGIVARLVDDLPPQLLPCPHGRSLANTCSYRETARE